MILLLACAEPVHDASQDSAITGPFEGLVQLNAYAFEPGLDVSITDRFWVQDTPTPDPDVSERCTEWASASDGWGDGETTYVDAGLVTVLFDGGSPQDFVAGGSSVSVFATGDVFPAFDFPDALELPRPVELERAAPPEDDWTFTWEPGNADAVVLSAADYTNHASQGWSCTGPDDGELVVPAEFVEDVLTGDLDLVTATRAAMAKLDVDGNPLRVHAETTLFADYLFD